MRHVVIAAALCAAASLSTADAVQSFRYEYLPAADICQGALPAFAGTLRARPLGLGNEGTASAFVTCGAPGTEPSFNRSISRVFLALGNTSGAPITINCTWVHGFANVGIVYAVKSTTVPANGRLNLELLPSDVGLANTATLRYPQASCGLPPGGVVYYGALFYAEDVGA